MLSYVLVAFLSVLLAVWFIPRDLSVKFGNESTQGPPEWLLSKSELSLYDGDESSRGLYLAILGHVFDVHQGHKHYGPGGAYHFMAGNVLTLHVDTHTFFFNYYFHVESLFDVLQTLTKPKSVT